MHSEKILEKVHSAYYDMLKDWDDICKKHQISYFAAYGSLLGAVRHKDIIPWDNDVDLWITRDNFDKMCKYGTELLDKYEWILPEYFGDKKYYASVPFLMDNDCFSLNLDEKLLDFYDYKINKLHIDFFFLDKTRNDLAGKIQRVELAILYSFMNAYRYKKMTDQYPFYLRFVQKCINLIGKIIPLSWLRKHATKVAKRFENDPKANYWFASNGIVLFKLFPLSCFETSTYTDFGPVKIPIPTDADTVLRICYGNYMQLPPEEERKPHWFMSLVNEENIIFTGQPGNR